MLYERHRKRALDNLITYGQTRWAAPVPVGDIKEIADFTWGSF